jgi:xylulokinase
MLLLGIDIGTSSIKVSVLDANTCAYCCVCTIPRRYGNTRNCPHPGWAEQSPEMWWQHVQLAIKKANASGKYQPQILMQ